MKEFYSEVVGGEGGVPFDFKSSSGIKTLSVI